MRTISIVLPDGYASAEEFAKDCGFELAESRSTDRREGEDSDAAGGELEDIWNATLQEENKGPQAYGWGWSHAMQTIRAKVENHLARRGNGIVREVVAVQKVTEPPPSPSTRREEVLEAARRLLDRENSFTSTPARIAADIELVSIAVLGNRP